MYCLARDCAGDKIARKFVAPALELIMLDKALEGKLDRREALLWFGEMYATAIAGDGTVERGLVELTVGGELGGGAALLRLATLRSLNQLLSKDLRFGVRTYVKEGRYYDIAAYGGDAARLKRLLAVSAPSAGGGYLSDKFEGFVGEVRVEVRFGGMRLTPKGHVAADLTISEGGVEVKYNVYLRRDAIVLEFISTDRNRAELAARLLRHAGVSAEVKRVGERDEWRVREALAKGWVDAGKAERWLDKLDKLEGGLTLREG